MPDDQDKDVAVREYRRSLCDALYTQFAPLHRLLPEFGLASQKDSSASAQVTGEELIPRTQELENPDWCGTTNDTLQTQRTREERAEGAPGPARAVAPQNSLLWSPGSTITYYLQQQEYRENPIADPGRRSRYQTLMDAFEEWSKYSGIQFVPVDNDFVANTRIFFHENIGNYQSSSVGDQSWTNIGKDSLKRIIPIQGTGGLPSTSMYLYLPQTPGGWVPGSLDSIYARRNCLHEVGHLLGLRHETANPRSKTVYYEYSPSAEDLPWIWTEWDPSSIMLYPKQLLLPPYWPNRTVYNTVLSPLDMCFVTVSKHLVALDFAKISVDVVFAKA